MTGGEVLRGGVANAGAVVRHGDQVARPASRHSATIHALFRHVRARGCTAVPEPRRIGTDGREWLTFVPGDVALPPFPVWSRADDALASVTRLLRQFHDATVSFEPPAGATWNADLSDPEGGDVICHNDVCLENVVFRHGTAVTLLDFDFAAPGRREFDLSSFASMWVPLDAPDDAARGGRPGLDPFARLRLVADAYGLPPGRGALIGLLAKRVAQRGAFVRRQVEAGIPAFVQMWHEAGGQARYDRRLAWFEAEREHLLDAVG